MSKEEVFICQCHSVEHQCIFTYDEEENLMYMSIHLNPVNNIFKRIWYSIRYIFGYKSSYGAWDEFFIKYKDKERLISYLNKMKS